MKKIARPTVGEWQGIAGIVETDNEDVPDPASCYPSDFGQDKLPVDFNTVRANAALMAQAKRMKTLLTACVACLGPEDGALKDNIKATLAKTRVEYYPHLANSIGLEDICKTLGHTSVDVTRKSD